VTKVVIDSSFFDILCSLRFFQNSSLVRSIPDGDKGFLGPPILESIIIVMALRPSFRTRSNLSELSHEVRCSIPSLSLNLDSVSIKLHVFIQIPLEGLNDPSCALRKRFARQYHCSMAVLLASDPLTLHPSSTLPRLAQL
jgi:hypothetical protein